MAANPRAAAVAALVRQEQDGFSNLVLDAELKRQQLEGRDKAFASAIFYTVLEHRGTLDYILCQFLPKGLAKLDAPVREILRAALAQARYMQVPVSAAVNEAVKLTRTFKKSSASGLVNAVLRKAYSYDLSTASFKNEVERLMVLGSAGRDVAEFLHKNYPDEALDILTYKADGGMTSLRANPLKGSADELCAKLLASGAKEAKRGIVPGSVLARFEGSPAENELFRQGYFHVEGQASQLAALCVDAQPGETVIDLCAAPGGKTILLAEQMHSTGRLYSCDAAENRVGLIRTAVQRMGLTNVEALCNDATKVNPALPQADRILADVPCSGLGILAKKPDLRYKKLEPAREAELLATQSAILDTAAQLLKAGGRLVYSTCTIDPAENQQQIAAFLARHPEFTVVEPAAALPAELKAMGQPGFRAKQIFHWVHQKLVTEFSAMTDQPKTLLAKLEESFYIAAPKIERRQEAKDGTVKYLLRMADGNCIETVVMRYHYGNTVCVSTQVGCRMGCRFCASTQAGRVRDLEAGEICSEIYTAQKDIGERISHIVLMGIGEPLDNFDEVMKFLENITSPEGVNIGMRNISLSTCGLVPKIDQLAEKKLQLTLSVSLHAPNNEIRSGMMPVNDAYPVEVLMQAVRRYQDTTGRRVSFEYSMVRGVNDSDACARQLANLIRGMGAHVNLIPINPVDGSPYSATDAANVHRFQQKLESLGVNATVRRRLGSEISAACGQLRRDEMNGKA